MDYSLEMAYNDYLLSSMLEQAKMETYIQEALILSEGVDVTGRLTSLNEGVGGKLKEVWQKFVDFIKRIFAKFGEAMTKVLDTDKGWLEKYQATILKKPFKLDVTCRDYKIERVIERQIPIFNYSQLRSKLETKAMFMNSIIPDFANDGNTDDLTGWCKVYFCNGREEEVKMVNPNMKDLYDYCHDFKDVTLPKLKQYQANIEKSATNANSLITQALNNAAQAASAQQKQNESVDLFAETSPYSRLFGKTLTELTINNPAGANASQTKAPEGDPNKKLSTNVPDATDAKGGETQDTAKAAVAAEDGLTEEKVNNIIGIYTSVAGAITSSAITVAQWAYTDYMKILRAHVKMYIADSDTPNQTPQVGNDYRPEDKKQPPQGNPQPNPNPAK